MKSSPLVGPYARAELAAWNQGPEPGDTDWEWLAVEAAAAALQEWTGDEEAVRIRDVLAPGAKIGYTYDFGADWEHEITLEQTIPRDPGQDYPVCVEWRGDSPVEYWTEDDPEEPEPFSLAEVNRELAALGGTEE
jgi:Plasmid pRiA4b ORF-3-like protein